MTTIDAFIMKIVMRDTIVGLVLIVVNSVFLRRSYFPQ
jgi:hypothetical protein